jgi:GntR family transcriptional regulator, transcriptional repressor for pyruvate dehydrogenase complex
MSPLNAPEAGFVALKVEMAAQFNQVRTRRVFEEICVQVRREMAAGTLRPGDKLPAERELAVKFGVSRTAVREALRTLEIAGVVGLQKGVKGGAFILEGDLDLITRSVRDMVLLGRISLDSLTETRTLIMQTAVGLVSQRISPQILAALESNTEELAKLPKSSAPGDRVRISARFYNLLAKATGNELLQVIIESLTEIVLQRVEARHMRAMPNLLEHRRRLIRLLAKRDVAAAQREVGQHLQALHRHLLREERKVEKNREVAKDKS